jgi:hypothetical protein
MDWYTKNRTGDTMSQYMNEDLLVQYLLPYIPWLTHLKDKRWLLIGSVKTVIRNLNNIVSTADNLEVCKKSCQDIIRDIYTAGYDEDGCDDEFEEKFGTDKCFIMIDGEWWMNLFLLAYDKSYAKFMIPIRYKLSEEEKKELIQKNYIDLRSIQLMNSVKLDYLVDDDNKKVTHPLYEKCYMENLEFVNDFPESIRTNSAVQTAHFMNKCEMHHLSINGDVITTSSSFLLPVKRNGIWAPRTAHHRKNTAYRIPVDYDGSTMQVRATPDREDLPVGEEPWEGLHDVHGQELQGGVSMEDGYLATASQETEGGFFSSSDDEGEGDDVYSECDPELPDVSGTDFGYEGSDLGYITDDQRPV